MALLLLLLVSGPVGDLLFVVVDNLCTSFVHTEPNADNDDAEDADGSAAVVDASALQVLS